MILSIFMIFSVNLWYFLSYFWNVVPIFMILGRFYNAMVYMYNTLGHGPGVGLSHDM